MVRVPMSSVNYVWCVLMLASEKVAELHESKLKMASFINTVGNGVKIEKTNPIYTYC